MDSLTLDGVSWIAAFLVGLMGGVHCVGMCGGIVTGLNMPTVQAVAYRTPWRILLSYNFGRIASYAVAGGLMGGVGAAALHWGDIQSAQLVLQAISALFLVALGLYLSGWWTGLTRVESLGALLWRRVEPLGRKLLPVRHAGQALALGAVWGWLPCGLVYSVLVWAIASGSAVDGALLLLSFGLGTLPNLLMMGVLSAQLRRFMARSWVRQAAGLLVMGFGLVTLAYLLWGWLG